MMSSKTSSSNNNHQSRPNIVPITRARIEASCYATSKSSPTGIQSFHYSSTGTDGMTLLSSFRYLINLTDLKQGFSGVPEASSGYPSSPPSHRRTAPRATNNGKGASRTIAKECERLLCRDMNRIFLGGGNNSRSVSDSMGSIFYKGNNNNNNARNHGLYSGGKSDMQFIEVWDYMGGASFRGFVAEKAGRGRVEKTLFLFFENVEGTQLKHGYALTCVFFFALLLTYR